MREYVWKNIRKNEETFPDDLRSGRVPRIQLELIVPPNDEEVTIWFPKDNKKTYMPKNGNIIYVMDDALAEQIDIQIEKALQPVKVRRVKPRRRKNER